MRNDSTTSPARAAQSAGTAVLLIHGFTGSRVSLAPWAEALNSAGYPTAAPALPGHETRWQDLLRVPYRQWIQATEQAFDELAATYDHVFVAGLSMGGALALHLATRRHVTGLLLVNPGLVIDSPVAPYARFIHRMVRSVAPISNDIALAGADEAAYPRTPVAAVAQLHQLFAQTRARLALVDAPILLFRSTKDNVVSEASVQALLAGLDPALPVQRVALERSQHVATLDYDAELIFQRSIEFLRDQPADQK